MGVWTAAAAGMQALLGGAAYALKEPIGDMIHNVGHEGGKLLGITQAQQRSKDEAKEATASMAHRYKASDIEAFSKLGSQLTTMTQAELDEAKPKATTSKGYGDAGASAASMGVAEKKKIEGLYQKSTARMGEVTRGRLRPGARKQSMLTRKY
tara:strand:+ start:2016 stop:2474 length:459 start_codon:yes stop_codon:yes gene_type:complete